MVAGRPSPAPLGPVYPAGSALGGGWGLLWPYRSRVVGWCLHAVSLPVSANLASCEIFVRPWIHGVAALLACARSTKQISVAHRIGQLISHPHWAPIS